MGAVSGVFHVFATRQHYIPLKYPIDIDWPCTLWQLCACVNPKGNIYKQTKVHAMAAGSTAASAMSVAMTKGIGMTAVAAAQSVGAAGISGTTAAAVGGAATGIWTAIKSRL